MLNDPKIRLLLIEDEDYDVRRIENTLKPFRDNIAINDIVSEGPSALDLLRHREYDVVIMDFQISGGLKGENLIREIKTIDTTVQIIVVTKMTMNVSDFQFANKLLEAGAMWYCTKYPGDIEDYIYQPTDFVLSILNAYEKKKLEQHKLRSDKKLFTKVSETLAQRPIVGQTEAVRRLLAQIDQAAKNDATVLISGSSGTGKELVAAHIHYKSARKLENFVPINCGSLPDHLIESELFGFEKGAFTGAESRKKGLFEIADRGTVFLDEVSELPLSAQTKLLRVIQEGEIDKIGRTQKVHVDVRIIAATNRDLRLQIEKGRFREDLFYRLNVFLIHLPALRERPADIPLLIEHFLHLYSVDMNQTCPTIKPDAMDLFLQYEWPGNVRQLQNVVQRLLFFDAGVIDKNMAESAVGTLGPRDEQMLDSRLSRIFDESHIRPWRETELVFQKEYFRFVRQHTRSDAEAARLMGLAPPNYHRVCKRLGLKG